MKITDARTPERKIENEINKMGFYLGCWGCLITIDKPLMKKTFSLKQYDTVEDCLIVVRDWIRSGSNPLKSLIKREK